MRWVVRDGRLRTPWRVLLFVLLVVTILWIEVGVVALLGGAPPLEPALSVGLVVQSALLLAAALLAGHGMLRWVDRRPGAGLGFGLRRRVPRELLAGLLAGGAPMVLAVAALVLTGGYRYVTEAGTAGGWLAATSLSLAVLAIPAAAEEALFRGYAFRTLVEGAGPVVAIGVTSLVFAWVHGANPGVGPWALVNIFLAGVLLGVAVLRTGSLWFATAVHLGWNWVMAGPLDLPVSGLEGVDVPLYDVAVPGPPWLTGGEFGPEGGLVGTVAAAVGLGLVVWMTRPGAALAGALNGRDDRVRDR